MAKKRLGKGLGALISEKKEDKFEKDIVEIFIENIEPNPFQPRENFNKKSLQELGQSIKDKGVIQPITVRQIEPEKFQLVAGERRWRASSMVGLNKIPAIINDFSDIQMMEIALIENLQREDLNPIEEAQAYQRMLAEFDMTQEDVAKKVGKSRSSIANFVRLLNLPPSVQVYVSRETLTMGHARALLSLDDSELQLKTAKYIINKGLSVRETEKHVSRMKNKEESKESKEKDTLPERWVEAQEKLSRHMQTKVKIKKRKDKKVLSIAFNDDEHLKKVISMMFHMKQ